MNSAINPNSQYFSIVPQNGTSFSSGNKIIFEVNPNIAFVKGKDCYLAFDIFNNSANQEQWAFPNTAGASSIIERMDIYSLDNGVLLESLQNWNQWAALENQYAYDTKDNLVAKEGVSEECYAYEVSQNQTTGITSHGVNARRADRLADMLQSPNQSGTAIYSARRYLLPLRSGIFNWWNLDEKLTPIVLYGGLRIEITLAEDDKVCQNIYGIENNAILDTVNTGLAIKDDGAVAGGNSPVLFSNGAHFASAENIEACGYVLGNRVEVKGSINGGAPTTTRQGVITALATAAAPNANSLEITLKLDGAQTITATANGDVVMKIIGNDKKYQVKKCELKLLQVLPTQQMMKAVAKESQINFLSYDLFLDTLPTSSLSHQTEITSVANRAKSIFSLVTNASQETANHQKGYYTGLVPNNVADPNSMRLNSIQYFINNKLFPLHDYNPQRTKDKVQAHNEVIKAWSSINKPCKNLGDSKGNNAADYTNSFLIARELARENMVYPLKNSEAELRTKYDDVRTFNSRFYSYVFSEKVVQVSKDGLSVIL